MCNELAEVVYRAFQKKTELLFVLVFDPYSAPNTDNQVPLSVFEWVSHDKKFRKVQSHVQANPSEIICANDLLKEVSGASLGGSGFVRGFKSWHGSFHNYQTKLQKLEQMLFGDTVLSHEQLRQIKEVVINYPRDFTDDHGASLQAKFTTANTVSLLASVLKAQQTQDRLVGVLAEKQKAAAK